MRLIRETSASTCPNDSNYDYGWNGVWEAAAAIAAPDLRFGGVATPGGYRFQLTGGRLCLDFANTRDQRHDAPRELLNGYEDVLDWGVQAGALSRGEALRLKQHASAHPAAARVALARAIEAREVIFEVFSAIARRRPVSARALDALNSLIAACMNKRCIEQARGSRPGLPYAWRWRDTEPPDFDRVVWPVLLSAAEVLTSSDLDRARQCEGAGCAWLFMDTSNNRLKRWCDMSVCGNRAKAKRFQARRRVGARKGRTS